MALQDLISKLANNDRVVGVACYGSSLDGEGGADYDLFVFLECEVEDVESIHFYFNGMPVDMSLRSLSDLDLETPIDRIDLQLSQARVLLDKTGDLATKIEEAIEKWNQTDDSAHLTEHDRSYNRFCQRHVLDKVKARVKSDPLYCRFLLTTNIYWLVETYFRVRGITYPGERKAIKYLREEQAEAHQLIQDFYDAPNLEEQIEITEKLTGIVLEPIGGPWKNREVLVFARDKGAEDLKVKGQRFYNTLMG